MVVAFPARSKKSNTSPLPPSTIFEYMEGPEYLYYMSKHAINLPVTISVQIAGSKQRATQNGREG